MPNALLSHAPDRAPRRRRSIRLAGGRAATRARPRDWRGPAEDVLLGLAGVWIFLGCCFSCPAAAAGEVTEAGLLYEVRAQGAPPSFLFGTIHSEDPRVTDLPPPVREAFEGSGRFAMEVLPDANAILRSMLTMVYTDGRTLEDVTGPDLYRQAVEAVKARGMNEAAIKDFKPWAVVTLLSVPRSETGEFLDMLLYRDALAAEKPVVGLESIDEQLAVFEDLSEPDQVALLKETLEAGDQLPAVFERLLEAYLARDLTELLRLSDLYLSAGDPRLAKRFRATALQARNRRMAERMRDLLDEGDFFIAVGALHLPGEGGILARLRAAGYQVNPVF
jgi:uncharacterized protein YbaP (TraB family)